MLTAQPTKMTTLGPHISLQLSTFRHSNAPFFVFLNVDSSSHGHHKLSSVSSRFSSSDIQRPFLSFLSWHSQNEMTPRTPSGAPKSPGIPLALTLGGVVMAGPLVKYSLWRSSDWLLARGHSQLRLQLLVHHVADADGGDDFEEVGSQASVEPHRALGLQDLFEEPGHFHLLPTFCSSCQNKDTNGSASNYDTDTQQIFSWGRKGRTLCLHAGADQSQRITGELPACARHGATGEQDKHAGVNAIGAVVVQVVVFQRLTGINRVKNIHSHVQMITDCSSKRT